MPKHNHLHIRIDDGVKTRVYAVAHRHGMTPSAHYIGTVDPYVITSAHYEPSVETLVTLSYRDSDLGFDIDCASDYTDAQRAAIWAALERQEMIDGPLPVLSSHTACVHVVALSRDEALVAEALGRPA